MRTFKVVVAYDGTDFSGFQWQANARTVQAELENALATIEGGKVSVAGAGRTDSGVHALGQVASFILTNPISVEDLLPAMNTRMAYDVRALSAEQVEAGFHARFSARSKAYRYRISNTRVMSPFERRFAWHISRRLDLGAMQEAAAELVGTHDFAAFQAKGGTNESSVRTISHSAWAEQPLSGSDRMLTYEIAGSGFLKYMVRIIVGTLVEVGDGRRPVASIRDLLAASHRSAAGPTAPALGLYLVRVDYDAAGPVSFS